MKGPLGSCVHVLQFICSNTITLLAFLKHTIWTKCCITPLDQSCRGSCPQVDASVPGCLRSIALIVCGVKNPLWIAHSADHQKPFVNDMTNVYVFFLSVQFLKNIF